MKIASIDYQMGNLFSVANACEYVGLDPVLTWDKNLISEAEGIILPGVGAYAKAMEQLNRLDLIDTIKTVIEKQEQPFLGICLGMQLLFSHSEEFVNTPGLDIIKGTVTKFRVNESTEPIRVPQIGWNTIQKNKESPVLNGIGDGDFMYFVHSFYCTPSNRDDILTSTTYGSITFCSSVMKNNLIATQFHPEKSSEKGILFYQNWANFVKKKGN